LIYGYTIEFTFILLGHQEGSKMLKSSFKPAKIVYFSVKVPAQDEIEEKEIESTCFNLKSKDETNSEWRVICNLRG
jgi:hypothetical protein